MAKHARHTCYRCSGYILPDVPEVKADAVKDYPQRYQHANEEDCRKEFSSIRYSSDWAPNYQNPIAILEGWDQ